MNRFNHESGRYLEVSGASIYYETLGNKENPVLVMLHGGFENIENLNSMVEYLVDDFYIIGIDARGHGKSTLGTDRMTYTLLQKDVECLLKHLKVDIANILGFSDGGIVAYRIAASGRIQVNKLITIGASWRNADIDDGEEALKSITPQVAKEIFQDNYDSYEQLNPEPDFNRFTKGIVDMWLDKSEDNYPNKLVKQITSDTLLIRGDNDFLVSLESLAALQKEIQAAALMNIPFAEHEVHEEQSEVVQIVLKEFLNK